MLPLDSPRWSELHPFFGLPDDVPNVLEKWWCSIGTDQEELLYARDLFDLFLHQNTITDVAYAIVPWLVAASTTAKSPCAAQYLLDVAAVEWNRLEYGVYWGPTKGQPGESPPDWLAEDYRQAIHVAGPLVEDLLDGSIPAELRDLLWRLLPALFGNGKLASERWRLNYPLAE